MATVSGNQENKVKVTNNQARYYSELAKGYSEQAGSYATAANTSATTASIWASSTQATATEAITTIGNATTDALGSISTATTNGVDSVNAKTTESLSIITATTTASTTTINALKTEALSVISATTSASTAAIQAVGTSVVSATTTATEAIKTSVIEATTTAVASATSDAVGSVNSAKTSALNTISGARSEALSTIGDLKTSAINTINTLTTEATTTINSLKTSAVNTINGAKTSALNTITGLVTQTQGYASDALIWAEGSDAQVQALGGTHSAKEWCLYNSTVNQNDVRALQGASVLGAIFRQGDSDSINSRLDEIKRYAHSTFDKSKFTVVGSPNITDDGIASGLQGNNFILCSNIDVSKETVFHYSYNMLSKTQPGSCYLICLHTPNITVYISSTGSISMYKGSTYGSHISSNSYDIGQLDFKLTVNSTSAVCEVYQKGVLKGTASVSYTAATFTTTNVKFGVGTETQYGGLLNAELDLKQFSITVDGVPVFSGNKTGIDTIKPDDYTVVGTPTISADGILSSADSSNYITTPVLDLRGTDWEYVIPINLKADSLTTPCQLLYNSPQLTLFTINTSRKIYMYFSASTPFSATSANALPLGKGFIRFTRKDTTYSADYSTDKINWTRYASVASSVSPAANSNVNIGGGYSSYALDNNEIEINLNEAKFYINGNLVWQGCLKIPYTESKTGSKIVNSIYRPRVNDMADQFGYANYCTLSDTDFTLPQVELYGLIGQRTLRDSYRNGINYWELYSNRDLEQGGSCTSGVEVTFTRPFADTNYVLSVPYSAKSATAFTPTQTGDWIAKGKGIL